MRWRKCDDIPVRGIECLCKCRKLTGETILRVLTPYPYRDKSGAMKISWYDENECYGEWKQDDVLGWYPLARLDFDEIKGYMKEHAMLISKNSLIFIDDDDYRQRCPKYWLSNLEINLNAETILIQFVSAKDGKPVNGKSSYRIF